MNDHFELNEPFILFERGALSMIFEFIWQFLIAIYGDG